MHLIYSKLKSPIVLNGKFGEGAGKNLFEIEFKPEITTPVKPKEYKILSSEKDGIFSHLLEVGDFIEKANKDEITVDEATKKIEDAEKSLALAIESVGNAEDKKAANAAVKEAKKNLNALKKSLKKG